MADMQINDTKIVIKKNQGLTWALKELVEKQPNSILSDGKITSKEWVATMDKLIEIQQKRKASGGGATIFTGGTDKTRAGWHTSFVVHPNQEITFTADEIKSLYTAMGVTFKAADSTQQNQAAPVEEQDNEAQTEKDSVVTVKKDSIAPVEEQSNAASAKTDSIAPVVTDNVELAQTSADSVALAANKEMLAAKTDSGVVVVRDNVPDGINMDKALIVAKSGSTIQAEEEPAAEPAQAPVATKKGRFELSWKQIGNIAIDSTKNFFKGMFCDEKGFSLSKTATTVGTVAALALAAPIAAAAGASAGVVTGVALAVKSIGLALGTVMAANGAVYTAVGLSEYLDSKTEEDAKANMSTAMDGAVELATSLPTVFALKGIANKTGKFALKKAEANAKLKSHAQPKPAEPAPAGAGTPKTAEEELIAKLFKKVPEKGKPATFVSGASSTTYKSGRRTVEICKDADGKITSYVETKHNFLKTKRVYEERDANGKLIERTSNRYGLITKKLKVSVSELADGRVITTKVDSNGNPIAEKPKKTEKTEKTENKPPEKTVGEPAPSGAGTPKTAEEELIAKLFKKAPKKGKPVAIGDGTSRTIYESGRKTVKIRKDADGKIVDYREYKCNFLKTKYVNELRDANGKLIEVTSDRKGLITGDMKVRIVESGDGLTTTQFYSNGKAKVVTTKNADGKITVEKFDKNGKPIIEKPKKTEQNTEQNTEQKPEIKKDYDGSYLELYRDANGSLVKQISKDANGNVNWTEISKRTSEGHTGYRTLAGGGIEERYYDHTGNFLKQVLKSSDGKVLNKGNGSTKGILKW